jgi:hypothetical protein
MISSGICQNQQTGLTESVLKLVSERSGGMSTGDGLSSGVLGEFQNSSLTVRPGRLHDNVLGVLNSHNHPRGELQLLPSLSQVDDEDAVRSAAPDVAFHLEIAILGAEMYVGSQHHLHILLTLREHHDCCLRWLLPAAPWGSFPQSSFSTRNLPQRNGSRANPREIGKEPSQLRLLLKTLEWPFRN